MTKRSKPPGGSNARARSISSGSSERGRTPARCGGLTLVELLVGLALSALLVVLALPYYGDWIADYQLLNQAQLLAGTMNIARAEAIKRGRRVNLCKSADLRQCVLTGNWESGYIVHVDADRDGAVDVGEIAVARGRARRPRASRFAATGRSTTTCRTQVSGPHAC